MFTRLHGHGTGVGLEARSRKPGGLSLGGLMVSLPWHLEGGDIDPFIYATTGRWNPPQPSTNESPPPRTQLHWYNLHVDQHGLVRVGLGNLFSKSGVGVHGWRRHSK